MLHIRQVLRGTYYGLRWRLKNALGIPDRPRNPVVDGDSESAFTRHHRICSILNSGIQALAPRGPGGVACEIGCGDCLSTADLFLGSGFERVYLVEKQTIVLDRRQHELLRRLSELPEFPSRLDCIAATDPLAIDERISIVPEYFENASLPEKVDILFSHDVLEHVEDLPGFFSKCASVLKPGGKMIHKFDLSGHEFFEDPIPPLDFQTYPTWLFNLVFPKYRRAVGHFADEIFTAMEKSGLMIEQVVSLRTADPDYLDTVWPKLRHKARQRSKQTVAMLDVIVVARGME